MNTVKKCSLSGIAFSMDPAAYEELSNYLETLKKSYKDTPEGAEIIADIEARIAELILATQNNEHVVGPALIRNIIAQMGSANQINDEEPRPTHSASARNPRRLYRDAENAKLGGVCAGIGKYFDIDPVWVRLGIFLPLIFACFGNIPFFRWMTATMGNLFGIFIICYLVMWFAVPVARTARQKLEMNGERITADSISKAAAAGNDPDGATKTVVAETVSVFGKIVLLLLKLFAGIIIFGLVLGACGMLIGLIYLSVAGHEVVPASIPLSVPITGIFIGLIPVLVMIYMLMCLLAERKPSGKTLLATLLLWIVTIATCASIGFRSRHNIDIEQEISEAIDNVAAFEPDFEVRIDEQEFSADELMRRLESGEIIREVQQGLQAPSAAQTADTLGSTAAPRTEKVQAGDRKMTVTIEEGKGLSVETDRKKVELSVSDKQ